jgi:hypothetical protein
VAAAREQSARPTRRALRFDPLVTPVLIKFVHLRQDRLGMHDSVTGLGSGQAAIAPSVAIEKALVSFDGW